MLTPDERRVWLRQAGECVRDNRATLSYVNACQIGIRAIAHEAEVKPLWEALAAHEDRAKKRLRNSAIKY